MSGNKLNITKRHLPHWTLPDSTYYITFTLKNGRFTEIEQVIVLKHIQEGNNKFYILFAEAVFILLPLG